MHSAGYFEEVVAIDASGPINRSIPEALNDGLRVGESHAGNGADGCSRCCCTVPGIILNRNPKRFRA